MLDALANAPRLVVDAHLEPVAGTVFQPTGFPDLGAATFERPGGPPSLLVESVQSMANHLEAVAWDRAAHQPVATMAGLPYVEVVDPDGDFLTSSRLEPHRLAAAYVRDGRHGDNGGAEWIGGLLGTTPGAPLDWVRIYRTVYDLDPMCLVHGVFFSDRRWHGTPRVRRALTAVIEAHDVSPVVSGGLKRDDVQITRGEGGGAREGYGFVPFGRTEYTARDIVLSAVIDLTQLRGYGLGAPATELLTLAALWELVALVEQPLRLRTACDLEVTSIDVRRPVRGFDLPKLAEIDDAIRRVDGGFEQSEPRRLTWSPRRSS
jgi:CRISPR-associated protein Csb1